MDETIKTYNRISDEFATQHTDSPWGNELEYFTKLVDGKKIIDIGCGHGRVADFFISQGFDYTGIDVSEGMLKWAKKLVKDGKFLLMDFYDLSFPEGEFDGFWASSALLHVPRRRIDSVLSGIKKIIKNGGIGFVSLKEKKNLVEGVIKEDQYGGSERFYAFYDLEEFEEILVRNHFAIIKQYKLEQKDNDKVKIMLCFFVKSI